MSRDKQKIVELRLKGIHPNEIARQLNCAPRHVRNVCSEESATGTMFPPMQARDDFGRRSINMRFQLDAVASVSLENAAAKRDCTIEELVLSLMTVIAKEPVLISNILDDGK
jgi:hypothetical protein